MGRSPKEKKRLKEEKRSSSNDSKKRKRSKKRSRSGEKTKFPKPGKDNEGKSNGLSVNDRLLGMVQEQYGSTLLNKIGGEGNKHKVSTRGETTNSNHEDDDNSSRKHRKKLKREKKKERNIPQEDPGAAAMTAKKERDPKNGQGRAKRQSFQSPERTMRASQTGCL